MPALVGLILACVAGMALSGVTPANPAPERSGAETGVIPGQYIVVFEDAVRKVGVGINQRERSLGFRAGLRYRHALRGFAARLGPGQVRRLRADPEVRLVAPDRRVRATGEVPLAPGDSAPTGVRRILAATDTTAREQSEAGVAVIDTGIDLSHPDLNAADGVNCIEPGAPASDVRGHGTHVAGTIAAKNNGAGLVGVAPGTDVHAVKVLGDDGIGSTASVVCGIDWVTANHEDLGIRVANMSLGGFGPPVQSCTSTTDPEHLAICNSTAAGVNYVVAAGNSGWDFDHALQPDVPAAYPEVLTVTAIADSDGLPGGLGPRLSCLRPREPDDTAARFSNFAATAQGSAHTIAAPGVCIQSTVPGGYATFFGTSMASPHMAGVAALCINESGVDGPCAEKTPAEVITHLRADAQAHTTANPTYGFADDPIGSPSSDRYYGFLTRAHPTAPPDPPPPPTNTAAPAISGTALEGETLTVSEGQWEGAEPIDLSYQWLRCDPAGDGCEEIDAATAATRLLAAADVGHTIRARVDAQNPGGEASATSDKTAVVEAMALPPLLPPPPSPAEDPPVSDPPITNPPATNPPTTPPTPAALSDPPNLEISRARVANGRLVVRGSLNPAASGERVTVRFRAAGRQILARPAVRPDGQFGLSRRLRGPLRGVRAGRLQVRFAGTDTLRAAAERLRAARRPVRLRAGSAAIQGGGLVVAGSVIRQAGGHARILVSFNGPNGDPAQLAARVGVNQRGRFRARLGVPPAARTLGTEVSITHPGRARLHGQRLSRLVGG